MGIAVNLPDSVDCLIRSNYHREPASLHTHVKDVVTRFVRRPARREAARTAQKGQISSLTYRNSISEVPMDLWYAIDHL
jgi:hypothetical protein